MCLKTVLSFRMLMWKLYSYSNGAVILPNGCKIHLKEFICGTVRKQHNKYMNFITFTCPVLLIKNYAVWLDCSNYLVQLVLLIYWFYFIESVQVSNSLSDCNSYCLYEYWKGFANVLRVIPEDLHVMFWTETSPEESIDSSGDCFWRGIT